MPADTVSEVTERYFAAYPHLRGLVEYVERARGAELASMGRALGRLLEQKRAAELEAFLGRAFAREEVPDQDIEALHDRCWQDADDTWWFAEGVECENPYMHTRPFTREEFRDFLGTVGTPKGDLS